MRKTIIIALVLATALWCAAALDKDTHLAGRAGDEAGVTIQVGYIQINSVTADDTAWDANTSYWDALDDVFIPVPKGWNVVELAFYGYGDGDGEGDPNDTTFTADVDACRWDGGRKDVAVVAGTIGAQQLSVNPVTAASLNDGAADSNSCWCDTLALSGNGDEWSSDVVLSGEGGNNGVATLSFDAAGYAGVWANITDMTAQSVTRVTCIMSGY